MLSAGLLGASTPPAGGAAISDVIYATAGAMVATVLLFGPILLYKMGRFPALGRLAELEARMTKLPGWAALPGTFLGVTLLIAVFGMYWDISLHIDQGRDPGPLANPAHYFILAGLFGVLLAGVLGLALSNKPTRTSFEIAPGWHAPIGALMITACGASSLAAFPLDDIWHRIFGQDVTLWGPTHLMLIGGASLSVLGAWALHAEGDEERKAAGRPLPAFTRFREVDPRRRLPGRDVDLPGRVRLRRAAVRARPPPHPDHAGRRDRAGHGADPDRPGRRDRRAARLPRDPGPARLPDRARSSARSLRTSRRTSPRRSWSKRSGSSTSRAATPQSGRSPSAPSPASASARSASPPSGAGRTSGSVNPWPASLFPEGAITGLIAAIAGRLIGGFIGRCLTPAAERTERVPRAALAVAAVAAVGVVAFLIPVNTGPHASATFNLNVQNTPDGREATGTFRLNPPDAASGAYWFNVTSWQGKDGPAHIDKPEQIGPGPLPDHPADPCGRHLEDDAAPT